MLKIILPVFLGVTYFSNVNSTLYKTNLTDLSTCKVYYSRSGSVYKDFYTLSELHNNDDTLRLDFHFSVLTPSDAHILLAPSEDVEKDDPAYEIVIGAGGNTFCDIRRKQKSEVKESKRIKGLLSALDPSSFWLHITKDGSISVGREGEELPFISWIDPDPLPLKVISFSAWSGIEAKWYFDCERKNETEAIEKPLTNIEKLRKDMLTHYNPYVRPVINISTVTTVSMSLQLNHVDLDEHESSIEVKGKTKLMWHDEKLNWDPVNYGDLDIFHIFSEEIWRPDIALDNAFGNGRDILKESMMIAHSNGLIEWNPAIYLKAWCDINDIGKWPRDSHTCNLMLSTAVNEFNHIEIVFNKNESSVVSQISGLWNVLEVNIYEGYFENKLPASVMLKMVLTVKRNSDVYNTIFFTPFFVISISILCTFWMDPFSKLKISVNCVQLILTVCMLLALAVFIPTHSEHVPYLVLVYTFTLLAILLSISVAILVINISRNKKNMLLHSINYVLTSKVLSMVLYLPKYDASDHYGQLHEVSSTKLSDNQQSSWILLGVAIDRIFFYLYLCLTIYAIYLNY